MLSLAALGLLVWLYRSTPAGQRLVRWALCMVMGGALGNIVDRIRCGEVIDFLDFGVGRLRWPVFNLADSFVTVGVMLLALAAVWPSAGSSQKASPAAPTAGAE